MQNSRRELKHDGRGVADLPIKLLVVMVILSVSIPLIAEASDNSNRSMMENEMGQEIDRIKNAVSVVYYSGEGSSRSLEIKLPEGCEISIGGEKSDQYSLKAIYNGEVLSTSYFEKPTVSITEKINLSGTCTIVISNIGDNNIRMSVT